MGIGFEMEFVSPDALVVPRAPQASFAMQPTNAGEEFEAPAPNWTIDQHAFNQLLHWLDPDPEAAGQTYELLRRKLIVMFACRGCSFPEDLADETIDRVARKLPQIEPHYVGSPIRYFYGVARKICLEDLGKTSFQYFRPMPPDKEDLEELLQHLDDALNKLEQADRELILDYYRENGRTKIENRKALAERMGLQLNALRLRVYRIKSQLRDMPDWRNADKPPRKPRIIRAKSASRTDL